MDLELKEVYHEYGRSQGELGAYRTEVRAYWDEYQNLGFIHLTVIAYLWEAAEYDIPIRDEDGRRIAEQNCGGNWTVANGIDKPTLIRTAIEQYDELAEHAEKALRRFRDDAREAQEVLGRELTGEELIQVTDGSFVPLVGDDP